MILKDDPVLVLGGHGMAGSAISNALVSEGYTNVARPTHSELDLLDQDAVDRFLSSRHYTWIIMAAAKVGGIMANMNDPSGFYLQNLRMSVNVIEASHKNNIPNLIYLGSSCVYPKLAEQPIRESSLLSGPLEPTNEGYALAKIAGIKLCSYYRNAHNRNYFSVMPTNLYGPGDNYHPTDSHVMPALIRRIHEAKDRPEVVIWGSGKPMREFMHVDDLAAAILHLAQLDNVPELINIGNGEEVSVATLASLIAEVTGFTGQLVFDMSKPDGTPRKKLDSSYLLNTGWRSRIDLHAGIRRTYQDFLAGKGKNIRSSTA